MKNDVAEIDFESGQSESTSDEDGDSLGPETGGGACALPLDFEEDQQEKLAEALERQPRSSKVTGQILRPLLLNRMQEEIGLLASPTNPNVVTIEQEGASNELADESVEESVILIHEMGSALNKVLSGLEDLGIEEGGEIPSEIEVELRRILDLRRSESPFDPTTSNIFVHGSSGTAGHNFVWGDQQFHFFDGNEADADLTDCSESFGGISPDACPDSVAKFLGILSSSAPVDGHGQWTQINPMTASTSATFFVDDGPKIEDITHKKT